MPQGVKRVPGSQPKNSKPRDHRSNELAQVFGLYPPHPIIHARKVDGVNFKLDDEGNRNGY